MNRAPKLLLAALLLAAASVSAQSVIYGNRPAVPSAAPAPTALTPEAEIPVARAIVRGPVDPNARIAAGTEVSFRVEEDGDAPVRVIVSDTGALEIPAGMGDVQVVGMTASQASAEVKSHLERKYYKPGKATVRIAIQKLPESAGPRPHKAIISGKVLKPGPVQFYKSDPKTLSEAIIEVGYTIYSDMKRVRVTRAGVTQEYNVGEIIDKGQTAKDFQLVDGDKIHIPARGLVFGGN